MGTTARGSAPSEASYPNVYRDKIILMNTRTVPASGDLYHKATRIAIRSRNNQGERRLIGRMVSRAPVSGRF